MSKAGNYGTQFELDIAATLLYFVGLVFIKDGEYFKSFSNELKHRTICMNS